MASVVVVGAGIGGLAAAARLAASGHDVTVLEAADAVGGKLGRHHQDGFCWDTGPSLLTMPQVLAELFADTGAPIERVLNLQQVDPVVRYRFADGVWLDTHADPQRRHAAAAAALGEPAADAMTAFLQHASRIWHAVEGPFLRSAPRGPLHLAAQARRTGDLAAVAPWRTLRELGRAWLPDPRLRRWLDRYATYNGSDPRRAPAALACIPYAELTFGAWTLPGGLRRLGDAVAERARERGATIRTGAPVRAVVTRGGRAAGVELAGGATIPADVVVAACDAWHLIRDLLPHGVADGVRRRLARAEPSLSGLVVLLGVRAGAVGRDGVDRLASHSVLFTDDYDAEFDALFGAAPRPVRDPTIYVHRTADPTLAPTGHEAWFVLVNAPRHVPGGATAARGPRGRGGGLDWDTPGLADREVDRVLALLAARGVDVRERVVTRAVRTPADLARDTRSPGGSIYGTASNGPAAAFLRPPNRMPVPGLFCVGGSAHPGGGLPLATLSAATVSGMIGPA